jgi:hypothetical protein
MKKFKIYIYKKIIKIKMNTPMCIFSSGIFTKACGSNSTPTRKCRLCFPGRMSSISVIIISKYLTLSSAKDLDIFP